MKNLSLRATKDSMSDALHAPSTASRFNRWVKLAVEFEESLTVSHFAERAK